MERFLDQKNSHEAHISGTYGSRRSTPSAASETTVLNTHKAIIDAFVLERAQSVIKEKRSVYFESHGKYDFFEETENILKMCIVANAAVG